MMAYPSELSFSESLKSAHRQYFYEQNKPLAIGMILIVLLMPFAGMMVRGLLGAVCGAVLSVVAYYLAPYLVLKMR